MAVENNKVLISIEVKQTGSEKVSQSTQKATQDLSKLTEAEKLQRIESEKLKITNAAVAASFREQAAAQLAAANNGKPLRAQAGLNNAILLETSRLASDAGYGFTAIANNLSQVISLFFSFTKTAGGVVNSLKELGRSIMGTGGILIAVQLLIAFGDDIYDFFAGIDRDAEKAKKQMDQLTESIRKQIVTFQQLSTNILDYNITGKALEENIAILSDRFSEFETGVKKLDLAQNKNDKTLQSLVDSYIKLNVTRKEIIELEKQAVDFAEKGIAANKVKLEGETTLAGRIREAYLEKMRLEELFTLEVEKQSKKTTKTRNRVFREGDLDFETERQKSRERILNDFTKSEEAQTIVQFQGIRDRARIKANEFKEDQKRRLDDFIARTKDDKQIAEAKEKYNQSIRESEEELSEYIIQLNREQVFKLNNISVEQSQELLEIDRKRQQDLAILNQQAADQEILNEGIKATNLLELKQEQLEAERLFIQQRLDNENLSFKERVKLQKDLSRVEDEEAANRIFIAETEAQGKRELLNQVGNALGAFSDLVGRETETGKALAITSTLISTYSTAQKAFESQFSPIRDVTSPVRGALAAAAAVARGLANVRAIESGGKSRPQSARQTVSVEAPDFNIVGASPESQLAQSVASQQAKPIKAFVVGKEITNQQELDRNIVTTAGLGG